MGLNDGLENPDCLIIGNSGDGFYETQGIGEYGASALALNSEGKCNGNLKLVITSPTFHNKPPVKHLQP
jgi:hypothetical protein